MRDSLIRKVALTVCRTVFKEELVLVDKLLDLLKKLLSPPEPKKGGRRKNDAKEGESKDNEEGEKKEDKAGVLTMPDNDGEGHPDDPLPEVSYKIVVLCEACSVRVPQTRGNATETVDLLKQRKVRPFFAGG